MAEIITAKYLPMKSPYNKASRISLECDAYFVQNKHPDGFVKPELGRYVILIESVVFMLNYSYNLYTRNKDNQVFSSGG
jgi:hypothetical protein